MTTTGRWMPDEDKVRLGFAAIATIAGLFAIAGRDLPEIDWPILGVTMVCWWAWAIDDKRFKWPMYALSLTGPFVVNIVESSDEIEMFIVVVAIAAIASFETDRTLAAALAIFAGVLALVLGLTAIDSFGTLNWIFGFAFSWGAGQMAWRYGRVVDELQQSRAIVEDHAAVNERRRIARDVHDLVGHSLSVVMLHVTGARHLVRTDPAEAERALEQAEEAGRRSLAEIRRTVAMLRDESESEAPAPSADLGDVTTLVDEFVVAGLDAVAEVRGPVADVDPAVALAGYRIVQEALTNASRHTIGARVIVTVRVDEDECQLAVINRGGENLQNAGGSGFGLVSMRERARSVGGSLTAGPTPSGWSVEAILPVEPAGVRR